MWVYIININYNKYKNKVFKLLFNVFYEKLLLSKLLRLSSEYKRPNTNNI